MERRQAQGLEIEKLSKIKSNYNSIVGRDFSKVIRNKLKLFNPSEISCPTCIIHNIKQVSIVFKFKSLETKIIYYETLLIYVSLLFQSSFPNRIEYTRTSHANYKPQSLKLFFASAQTKL